MKRISCQDAKFRITNIHELHQQLVDAMKNAQEFSEQNSIAQKIKLTLEKEINELQKLLGLRIDIAREIMGENFYGSEEIERAFGFKVLSSEIPPIPYSKKQLRNAMRRGDMLILRVAHDNEGKQMTLKRIQELIDQHPSSAVQKSLLGHSHGYTIEKFFHTDHLIAEWRIVGSRFIKDPNRFVNMYEKPSIGANYMEQTRILRSYLKSINELTDEEERECTDKKLYKICEQTKVAWDDPTQLVHISNLKKYAKKLANLKINRHHRRSPAEMVYDFILQKNRNPNLFFSNKRDASRTLSSLETFVCVGYLDDPNLSHLEGMVEPNRGSFYTGLIAQY